MTRADRPPNDTGTDRFWRDSLNDWWDLMGRPAESAGAGPHRRAGRPRHSLPAGNATAGIGDLRLAFSSFRASPAGAAAPTTPRLTTSLVSTLLHYTYGLTRMAVGPHASSHPYHRTVPSARGFFPTELYCWLPATDGLGAGFYAYDAPHHALTPVRPMEATEAHRALGSVTGARLRDVRAAFLLTSRFARTAHHYNSYAYRLCAQEAGIVAGNALTTAGVLGFRGVLHHRLRDTALTSLLGITDAGEGPAAVVTLHAWPADGASRPLTRTTTAAEPAEGTAPAEPPPGLDPVTCADLLDLDARSRRVTPRPLPLPAVRPAARPAGGSAYPLPAAPDGTVDAATALTNRTSGAAFGDIGGLPARDVDLASLAPALRYALDPHLSDLVPAGERPPVSCYLAALAVSDLPDAFYRWSPRTAVLRAQSPGPAARRLDELYLRAFGVPTWTFSPRHRSANALFYLAVDRAAAEHVFGDRAYRILHQEAGVIAQRLCLLCAAEGLAARVHNGYPAAAVGGFLGLPDGVEVVAQILVSRNRPGGRLEMELTP
ncbi:nitroreductase family protein [Streptomyces sp. NPDC055607]